MGSAPAANIEVTPVSEDEAEDLIETITEQFDFENTREGLWELDLPSRMQSDEGIDSFRMHYSQGFSEYLGNSRDSGLIVHYSSYYTEDADLFKKKLDLLDDIKQLIEQQGYTAKFYVSASTI